MAEKKAGFSKYMGLTFLIGFGFFTMGLMDPLYDTYVPIFLGKHIASMSLVGLLMALDNILAIFLIPVVTVMSDRTRTPLGRRMPWILALLPLSAITFSLLPYAVASLAMILLSLFALNIFKQSARGPVVALMPDLIPGDYRSEANGVINTMGGIAAIVGTLFLAPLMNVNKVLPLIGATKDRLPFPIAGVLVVLATLLLLAFIRENKMSKAAGNAPEKKPEPFLASLRKAWKEGGSAFLVLVALFLWFLGYQGVLPFIGKYANETLGVSKGLAAFGAGAVGIAYAIFAIPSGYAAHKLGRRRVIRFSLAALVLVCLVLFGFDMAYRQGAFGEPFQGEAAFKAAYSLSEAGSSDPALAVKAAEEAVEALPRSGFSLPFIIFLGILFVFGIFWVSVITNSFPMLWQMAGQDTMGIYTGLYYTFSQLSSILAPLLSGILIDVIRKATAPSLNLNAIPASLGYSGMFVFAALCMGSAFFVMRGVKKGEASQGA